MLFLIGFGCGVITAVVIVAVVCYRLERGTNEKIVECKNNLVGCVSGAAAPNGGKGKSKSGL